MGQNLKLAENSVPVAKRHGKNDTYRICADVSFNMKNRLVLQAQREGITMRALINDILDFYFDGIR